MPSSAFLLKRPQAIRRGEMPEELRLKDFFAAAIKRRRLSIARISSLTGMTEPDIKGLIAGEKSFDHATIAKLQPAFPNTANVLRRLDRREKSI